MVDMEDREKSIPANNNSTNKLIIVNFAAMILLFAVFMIVNFFMQDSLLNSKLKDLKLNQEEVAEEDQGEEIDKGIIVDLGDFVLNLSDEGQRKYLKTNVALELTKLPRDIQGGAPEKKGGHGHGEGEAAPAPNVSALAEEMNQYKPAIRDAVITNLSSKTSYDLMTAAGKELAKEQIADDINAILGGEREVLRVSFGQFIIQ
ncbi:flagellar basal body-associated FliL family protein [bacterium]|nr:flagellar basal body-associated FliL family protein [bacterium]